MSLDELRDRDRDTADRLTMRDLLKLHRRYRDGTLSCDDLAMVSAMGDLSWGDRSPTGRSPRRRPRGEEFERVAFQQRLTRTDAAEPEIVDRVRTALVHAGESWCDGHGYLPEDVTWETVDSGEFPAILVIRLTIEITPRTDGEWPAIRAALAEDEADRAAAATPSGRLGAAAEAAAEATSRVGDRLDALREAFRYWGDPVYRNRPAAPEIGSDDRTPPVLG